MLNLFKTYKNDKTLYRFDNVRLPKLGRVTKLHLIVESESAK